VSRHSSRARRVSSISSSNSAPAAVVSPVWPAPDFLDERPRVCTPAPARNHSVGVEQILQRSFQGAARKWPAVSPSWCQGDLHRRAKAQRSQLAKGLDVTWRRTAFARKNQEWAVGRPVASAEPGPAPSSGYPYPARRRHLVGTRSETLLERDPPSQCSYFADREDKCRVPPRCLELRTARRTLRDHPAPHRLSPFAHALAPRGIMAG